jgi:hypothetical protein
LDTAASVRPIILAGHLAFAPLVGLLLGKRKSAAQSLDLLADRGGAIGSAESMELAVDDEKDGVGAPNAAELLRSAGIESIPPAARNAVLAAMRGAAEKRLAGVTEEKRRRHYGHPAALVAACLECDRSKDAMRWLAAIRERYRRFPALGRELERAVRRA